MQDKKALFIFTWRANPSGGVDQENMANGNYFRQFVRNDVENLPSAIWQYGSFFFSLGMPLTVTTAEDKITSTFITKTVYP
jgi:hypothetical protein